MIFVNGQGIKNSKQAKRQQCFYYDGLREKSRRKKSKDGKNHDGIKKRKVLLYPGILWKRKDCFIHKHIDKAVRVIF